MHAAIVTADSGIVTSDSGKIPKIGHDETEWPVTFLRNRRSRSNGMCGHVAAEYAGLGNFAILWQIEHARTLNLSWLYLGFWIESCQKMAYKTRYKPVQGFVNGKWKLMEG